MTTDNPAGRPADDFGPGDAEFANEIDEAQDELVDDVLDDDEVVEETLGEDEEGEYYDDDEYGDEEYYDDEYDDDEYDDDEYDDDEYDDDEYDDDEYDDDEVRPKKKKKRRVKMHCFHCNRPEGFFTANKGRWFYSYFLGLTFGLGSYIGPFKCQCCGHKRLMKWDFIHPRIWFKKPTVETKNI